MNLTLGLSLGATGVAMATAPAAPSGLTASIAEASLNFGDTATANVSVSGNPAPTLTYQWTLDGADVAGQTGSTFEGVPAGTLRVRVTAMNSEGAVGPVTSGPVTVLTTMDAGTIRADATGTLATLTLASGDWPASQTYLDPDTGITWTATRTGAGVATLAADSLSDYAALRIGDTALFSLQYATTTGAPVVVSGQIAGLAKNEAAFSALTADAQVAQGAVTPGTFWTADDGTLEGVAYTVGAGVTVSDGLFTAAQAAGRLFTARTSAGGAAVIDLALTPEGLAWQIAGLSGVVSLATGSAFLRVAAGFDINDPTAWIRLSDGASDITETIDLTGVTLAPAPYVEIGGGALARANEASYSPRGLVVAMSARLDAGAVVILTEAGKPFTLAKTDIVSDLAGDAFLREPSAASVNVNTRPSATRGAGGSVIEAADATIFVPGAKWLMRYRITAAASEPPFGPTNSPLSPIGTVVPFPGAVGAYAELLTVRSGYSATGVAVTLRSGGVATYDNLWLALAEAAASLDTFFAALPAPSGSFVADSATFALAFAAPKVGEEISVDLATLVSGGVAPYSYGAPSHGAITGGVWTYTPAAPGEITVAISVSDARGVSATLTAPAAIRRDLYVSTLGDDATGDGSALTPFATPQRAADMAQAGDTIYLAAGTYGGFLVPETTSGTAAAPVIFTTTPEDKHLAIIDGGSFDLQGKTGVEVRHADHIQIRNLIVQNWSLHGVLVTGHYAPEGEEHGHHVIADCIVRRTGSAGVQIEGWRPWVSGEKPLGTVRLRDVVVERCDVSYTNMVTPFNTGNAKPGGMAESVSVVSAVADAVVRFCDVHDSRQYGIDFKHGVIGGAIHDNRVWNVLFYGVYLDSAVREVENIAVYNNRIWGCSVGFAIAREGRMAPGKTPVPIEDRLQRVRDIDVHDNWIWDCWTTGVFIAPHPGDGPYGSWENISIRANVIYNCARAGTGNEVRLVDLTPLTDPAHPNGDGVSVATISNISVTDNIIWRDALRGDPSSFDAWSGKPGFTVAGNVNLAAPFAEPILPIPSPATAAAVTAAVAGGYVTPANYGQWTVGGGFLVNPNGYVSGDSEWENDAYEPYQTAANGIDSATAPTALTVAIAELSLAFGDTATLTISVNGFPAPTLDIQWTLDGVNVEGQTGPTFDGVPVGALRVRVTATNSEGSAGPVTSDPVTVVALAPDAFSPGQWTVDATGASGEAAITLFGLPPSNGSAITSIERQVDGGAWVALAGIALDTAYAVSGLTDDAAASLGLRAVNSAGAGPESAAKTVTPFAPVAPAMLGDNEWTFQPVAASSDLELAILRPADGETALALEIDSAAKPEATFTALASGPVALDAPTVSGAPAVGQTLTAGHGRWLSASGVTGYAYQWKRGGVNIIGATASTYTLVADDAATNVTVAVTAADAQGSTASTSAAMGVS